MPPAVLPYMEQARRIRSACHDYCGPHCFREAGIAGARRTAREVVRALRTLRRMERAGILGTV